MVVENNNILGTRDTEEMYNAVKEICKEAEYNKLGRTITINKKEQSLEIYSKKDREEQIE